MKQEIERKYQVKYLPEDLKIEKVTNIKQCFIYNDKITLVRLRKIATLNNDLSPKIEYIYTVKTKGDIEYKKGDELGKKYEIENNITEREYSKLLERKISNSIDKTRIVVPIEDNLKAEIDIYYGYLEGLLTLEVEFESEEEANNFVKPDWFGEELGYKVLSNRKLSEMSKEEFESIVTEEFMNNNRKIINELENNKVINFKKYK